MQFNSFTFFIFFLCVLAIHSLPIPAIIRRCNLLVASYLYYAAWDPRFTFLLVFVTVTNWWAAKWIARFERTAPRRIVLWLDVVLNVGLLCAFKYGNEALSGWHWLAEHLDLPSDTPTTTILLPVGLSFFIFQALSYTIDVYRRTIPPAASAIDFAIFVSFFPVLLAGPLLRAANFLPTCAKPRRATGDELGYGMALVALGLFMKVALADHLLSPVARQVFDTATIPNTLDGWMATLAFAGQDYCDFAGYSTCAMGLGMCLGFKLPENFRAPFASVGFRDLWQRWHITLVAWMRDYVFTSLGGVYKGYTRAAINVMVVMVLIGLWHGAAWTYLIFGMLHGFYLIGETILQRSPVRRLPLWNGVFGTFLLWVTTTFLCCLAFVFYRTPSLPHAWQILVAMFGVPSLRSGSLLSDYDVFVTLVVIEALIAAHWLRRKLSLDQVVMRVPWWATALGLALMLFAITLCSGESENYLYFNY